MWAQIQFTYTIDWNLRDEGDRPRASTIHCPNLSKSRCSPCHLPHARDSRSDCCNLDWMFDLLVTSLAEHNHVMTSPRRQMCMLPRATTHISFWAANCQTPARSAGCLHILLSSKTNFHALQFSCIWATHWQHLLFGVRMHDVMVCAVGCAPCQMQTCPAARDIVSRQPRFRTWSELCIWLIWRRGHREMDFLRTQ